MRILSMVLSKRSDNDLRKMRDAPFGATIRQAIVDEIVWRAHLCGTPRASTAA